MKNPTRANFLAVCLALLFVESVSALSEPEVSWRWVGIKSSPFSECPNPGDTGWSVEKLFPASPGSELARFCLYSREAPAPIGDLLALPLERLDPDVMAVTPHGSELADLTWTAFKDHFLSQVEEVALPLGPQDSVRLALIDSSPTGEARGPGGPEDLVATSPHGSTLLNIARRLVCDPTETQCQARLTSRLGLAYECYDATEPGSCRNEVKGGYLGLISELAQSVAREVTAFQSDTASDHLVINLSVGWDPSYGGTETLVSQMPAPVQAMYRAVELAACRGALVVAAAGNRGASPESQVGPIMPAAWEMRGVSSSQECLAAGFQPSPGLDGPTPYRPLLFSVGGVTADGGLLDNTRRQGAPRLAAFSDHAVVEISESTERSGILIGTSVSSAVVSATAAVLWSYFPSLDPFELMEKVYAAALPLGRDASYCLGGSPCTATDKEQHEVALCRTLAQSCAASPDSCTAPICAPRQELSLVAVDFSTFNLAPTADLSLVNAQLAPAPPCGNETMSYQTQDGLPVDRCPHRQYYGGTVRPWTEPQPESIPCPPCVATFASPGTLYFEVDDSWNGLLSSGTLKCGTSTFALELPVLEPGDKAVVREIPESCLSSFPTQLSFTVDGTKATVIPLRLCQDCT